MAPDEMTHLPEDLRAGISAYDDMVTSGRLTFEDHPMHDQPALDGKQYLREN